MTQALLPFLDTPTHCVSTREPPRQLHSETSCRAAESIKPHVGRMQQAVLDYIAAHGPVSDNQIIAAGVVSTNGTRARRIELLEKKLIERCGERDGSWLWKVKEPAPRLTTAEQTALLQSLGIREGATYDVAEDGSVSEATV